MIEPFLESIVEAELHRKQSPLTKFSSDNFKQFSGNKFSSRGSVCCMLSMLQLSALSAASIDRIHIRIFSKIGG